MQKEDASSCNMNALQALTCTLCVPTHDAFGHSMEAVWMHTITVALHIKLKKADLYMVVAACVDCWTENKSVCTRETRLENMAKVSVFLLLFYFL